MAALLAVAALSARMLAEAAVLDGHAVIALDLFGDADTRRASQRWQPIGASGSVQIDGARLLDALQTLAWHVGDKVIGLVPGSGFEGQPDLLEAGAQLLPLIGTPAEAVRRVRDPAVFFEVLAAHGIEHPPVRANAPADTDGWLLKDARGCGGWHIRHAHTPGAAASASAWHYFQRQVPGVPMSATFIANGERASVLGLNELIVRPFGAHPHVYCGCIGPVAASADLAQRIGEVVELLTAAFGLRGWCSLDFILGSDHSIAVLEVNPRPPASLLLYAQPGLMDAQLRACLQGELPTPAAFALRDVRGSEIVYARHPLRIDERGARYLAGRPDAHDLPLAGSCFDAGDPICSLSAAGDTAEHVRALLLAARDAVMHTLERPS